mmetsp:Transcript_40902/g.87857  ORF Transcript_40902/g.87857 Transcript_40902/m.87857 type:complete len:211 (+) Transcript_40902:449-1081(+)
MAYPRTACQTLGNCSCKVCFNQAKNVETNSSDSSGRKVFNSPARACQCLPEMSMQTVYSATIEALVSLPSPTSSEEKNWTSKSVRRDWSSRSIAKRPSGAPAAATAAKSCGMVLGFFNSFSFFSFLSRFLFSWLGITGVGAFEGGVRDFSLDFDFDLASSLEIACGISTSGGTSAALFFLLFFSFFSRCAGAACAAVPGASARWSRKSHR